MTSTYSIRPTTWSASLSAAALGALALSLIACQGGERGDRSPEPQAPPEAPFVDTGEPLSAGPEQTVAIEADETKLAFERRAGGFRGGHLTHQVDITNGLIEISARPTAAVPELRASPTLGLQTAAVWRGEELLDATPLSSELSATNVVTTARAAFHETVRNVPEGIEQSWHFDTAPAGEGDLMITVAATGLDYQGTTAGGLHFRRAGELGLRYGHGTWIEADGDRWDVPAAYDSGRIVLAVPADIVAASAYPAVLDPVVSAEVFNDVPVNGASGADNAEGDVAGGGSTFLVAWQDRRNTRNDDLWGTFVDLSGAVANPRGIKIYENATTVESNPAVAFAGNDLWIVAWESAGNIAAATVTAAGVVTQLGTIAGTAAVESAPAIVGDSAGGALLTWTAGGTDVLGAHFSGAAFTAPFAIAATAATERNPAVAVSAADYLVVFQEGASGDNIRGQRVTRAGALDGAAFDISTDTGAQTSPVVDFNGENFVAAWATSNGAVLDVRGARISPAGALLDLSPGVLISGAPEQQTLPEISCSTTNGCLVTWQDRRQLATTGFDIRGAVVSSTMTIGAEKSISLAQRAQTSTATARVGQQWFTVWTDLRDGETRNMRGTLVSGLGDVDNVLGVQLGTGFTRHASPTVTHTPSIWSVMWGASTRDTYDVVHVRYSSAGTQLDATPRAVADNTTYGELPTGAIYDGTSIMAVWTDNRGTTRDIYGGRIDPTTGARLDSTGFPISTAAFDQAGAKIASNGATSLVVWQDRRSNSSFDIYGALVNGNGTIAVAEFLICANPGDQTRPAVAYDAANGAYLVAWSDAQGAATNDIRGARVSAAGALLDANCGVAITSAPGSQTFPDLAFAGGRFLAVWEDRRSDTEGDIYGARVSLAGGAITIQDPGGLAIAAVATEQSTPTVSSYGANFVVAWRDSRNLATTKLDIYGTRVVSTNGAVEPAFAIASSIDDEQSPDISDGPTATSPAKVAYLRTRPDLDSVRVQVRRITFQTSTGAACSNGSQCASGFCVDSRCCDTACGGTTIADCQACSVARGAASDGVCSIIAGPNQVICRNYAQNPGICDLREYCTGSSAACPVDVGINQGVVCNAQRGTVCPSNTVAGAPHICP